jgi:murein tripeptide amidase MpaA
MSGLELPLLKIRNHEKLNPKESELEKRPIILIIGRVNPYQAYSSYTMHAMINHMLSKDPLVHKLRSLYEIWLLPMLNPDGVAVGNHNNNIEGKELGQSFYVDLD